MYQCLVLNFEISMKPVDFLFFMNSEFTKLILLMFLSKTFCFAEEKVIA